MEQSNRNPTSRRRWLTGAVVSAVFTASPALAAKRSRLKLGVTDWNLGTAGKVEGVALAKKLGFAGVEVSLGRKATDGKLPLDDSAKQDAFKAAFREHGIVSAGTCLDILHVNYLKSDKLGQKWVIDGIAVTRKLDAKVMLLPFFGKGATEAENERQFVADFLKDAASEAERAGIVMGLENTCSAEQNARMLDRIQSKAVRVYYDVGNSTKAKWDVLKEIPWLGADRICQFHLKDNPHFLGEGTIEFPKVMDTILALGFNGFANLETHSPTKMLEDDMIRNRKFVEGLMRP